MSTDAFVLAAATESGETAPATLSEDMARLRLSGMEGQLPLVREATDEERNAPPGPRKMVRKGDTPEDPPVSESPFPTAAKVHWLLEAEEKKDDDQAPTPPRADVDADDLPPPLEPTDSNAEKTLATIANLREEEQIRRQWAQDTSNDADAAKFNALADQSMAERLQLEEAASTLADQSMAERLLEEDVATAPRPVRPAHKEAIEAQRVERKCSELEIYHEVSAMMQKPPPHVLYNPRLAALPLQTVWQMVFADPSPRDPYYATDMDIIRDRWAQLERDLDAIDDLRLFRVPGSIGIWPQLDLVRRVASYVQNNPSLDEVNLHTVFAADEKLFPSKSAFNLTITAAFTCFVHPPGGRRLEVILPREGSWVAYEPPPSSDASKRPPLPIYTPRPVAINYISSVKHPGLLVDGLIQFAPVVARVAVQSGRADTVILTREDLLRPLVAEIPLVHAMPIAFALHREASELAVNTVSVLVRNGVFPFVIAAERVCDAVWHIVCAIHKHLHSSMNIVNLRAILPYVFYAIGGKDADRIGPETVPPFVLEAAESAFNSIGSQMADCLHSIPERMKTLAALLFVTRYMCLADGTLSYSDTRPVNYDRQMAGELSASSLRVTYTSNLSVIDTNSLRVLVPGITDRYGRALAPGIVYRV